MISYSITAEVSIPDEISSDDSFNKWIKHYSNFEHKDSYEYVIHLFSEESNQWFEKNYLNFDSSMPENVQHYIYNNVMEARGAGAVRIIFYI